jgi:membrane protein
MARVTTDKPTVPPRRLQERGRGRHAEKPRDVPTAGWLDILARTKRQISEDNLTVVAAGVAFYCFVAVVPALAVVIAIYGLIADPSQVAAQITAMATVVPDEVLPMLETQMKRITSDNQAAGISAIIGVLVAIYSSANATKALISGLNIAYDETEKRGFFRLSGIAMALTLGGIVSVVFAISLVAVLPSVLERLSVTRGVETLINWLRWPVLVGGFMAALAVLYRFGPSRHDAKWRWVTGGAVTAAVLWLIGSGLFSLYVTKVGSYDKTYGPLGAVVVFMMWLFITALSVLVGAELNAETERQTVKDTTIGEPKPLGERGATAADTKGPSREELRAPRKQ